MRSPRTRRQRCCHTAQLLGSLQRLLRREPDNRFEPGSFPSGSSLEKITQPNPRIPLFARAPIKLPIMPTPSSNQPSQPPSPQGFSSCPDDIQSPPRLGWQMGRDDETSDQHDTDMTRSDDPHTGLAVEHPPRRIESGPEDSLLAEERTTIEPSSRATTMSPQPQSSVTSGTSPESANSDPDMNKRASADIPAHFLNQAATDATMADHGSSVDRRTPEEATSDASSPPDASDLSLDDDLYAPSMGSYYPSMRVGGTSIRYLPTRELLTIHTGQVVSALLLPSTRK